MTRADWTPLAGDPTATVTEQEWAQDMKARLLATTPRQRGAWLREMSDDEYELIRPHIEGLPS